MRRSDFIHSPKQSFNTFMRDRVDIQEQLNRLKMLDLDGIFCRRMFKFYFDHPEVSTMDIDSNFEFLYYVLTCYGYNDEEFISFARNNFWMIMCKNSDFRCRLSIFNSHFMLDEVLFRKNTFLSMHDREIYGTRGIYSLMQEYDVSDFEELEYLLSIVSISKMAELVKAHPLSREEVIRLDRKLLWSLEFKKRKNSKSYRKDED